MRQHEQGRRSIRLKGYDYSTPGAYFITVCTQDRHLLFGQVFDGNMAANRLGTIVQDCWTNLPHHYCNIALDAFILMPNHVHGVIMINDPPAYPTHPAGVGGGFQTRPPHRRDRETPRPT